MKRIVSIDFTRGLVMIIMALDHVRDLMHVSSTTASPTDLANTTVFLFFTRWITHLCAPVFVFLAGTSVYLSLKRQNNKIITRNFLIKRGLWLIFLEFTIINFGIWFDLGFHTFLFQVIAVIGIGFIILALVINLRTLTIGIIGLIIILCHNLLPLIPFQEGSVFKTILFPFFATTIIPIGSGKNLIIGYPLIPWLGIMFAGFAAGKLFEFSIDKRKRVFIQLSLGSILLFVIIRLINVYGDPSIWSIQKNNVFTFLSFINVTKYPPSLLFCLVTLGIMFFILALAEKFENRISGIFSVYGRVPFFYYLLHWYIIHPLLIVLMFLQGFHWSDLNFASGNFGRPLSLASGFELWLIYLIWISMVLILYKPCVWFSQYKAEHKQWWLRYL